MKSKFLATLLAVCMIVTLVPAIAFAGETQAAAVTYTDLAATHWSKRYIDTLSDRGILSGYPDGSFKPDALVTRAEFAKMVVLYMGAPMPATAGAPFSDVSENHWAKELIAAGKATDIIGGYPGGVFKPDTNITRAEITKIVVAAWPKVAKFKASSIQTVFPDIGGHWALNDITTLRDLGVADGYPDGMFKPDRNATRAEAAKLLYLLITSTTQTTSGGSSSGGGPAPQPEPTPSTRTLVGKVVDANPTYEEDSTVLRSAATSLPTIPGAKVSLGSPDADTATVNSEDGFKLVLSAGSYNIWGSHPGYVSDFIHWDVTSGEDTQTLPDLPLVPMPYEINTGTVSGIISDALTGDGVGGLTIKFRRGINVKSGDIAGETITEPVIQAGAVSSQMIAYGYYDIELPAGNYTGEITGEGYETGYFYVTSLGDGRHKGEQNGVVSPVLPEGATRIVLTWGLLPDDLDSHLTGPVSGSSDRFHVYYSYDSYDDTDTIANLDVDDTESYGPETITILKQGSGTYRYSVHDYANADETLSSALAGSGAKVTVYRGSQQWTFNVPAGEGTLWTVFELSGDTLTPINAMSYQPDEVDVQ